MNARMKEIRKVLKLSQEEFSKRIGVTRSAISRLESGEINFTEQMIKSICREFNVNRMWLVDGIGDMFNNKPYDMLDSIASLYNLSDKEKEFILDFCQLPPRSTAVYNKNNKLKIKKEATHHWQ